jgi:solute carrier family 25 (mitochondrial adenine nucleotide translocator), member 4/5/6/31
MIEDKPNISKFLINSGYVAANAFKLATVERASMVF